MRDIDHVEKQACLMVVKNLGTSVRLETQEEMLEFVEWCVKEFSENMRRYIKNGGAPF